MIERRLYYAKPTHMMVKFKRNEMLDILNYSNIAASESIIMYPKYLYEIKSDLLFTKYTV